MTNRLERQRRTVIQRPEAGISLRVRGHPPASMHVGLNLIFLVPGETGGMEVCGARADPGAVSQAPAGVRFTAFVNREAAAARGAVGRAAARGDRPVNARNRPQWVLGEQLLLPPAAAVPGWTCVHSLGEHGARWGPFRRVVTIHDLIYARFPEAHRACAAPA